ncbi:hypothetical protein D3C81_2037180 [compost metagenome]
MQDAHTAVAVGQNAGQPTANGGEQQRYRAQHSRLALVDAPQGHQRGDHEGEHHEVQGVDGPASERGNEGAAFGLVQLSIPLHGLSLG